MKNSSVIGATIASVPFMTFTDFSDPPTAATASEPSGRDVQMSIRISRETYDAIEVTRAVRGLRSRADVVRAAIQSALAAESSETQ